MEQNYFQSALSDFVFDMASGGAICHLTDLGFTVKQIQEKLAYPTPYEKVQKAVWKHLLDTGVIAMEEQEEKREKVEYVREYDSYGKASFRRVTLPVTSPKPPQSRLLCRFGLLKYKDPERYSGIARLHILDFVAFGFCAHYLGHAGSSQHGGGDSSTNRAEVCKGFHD